MNLLITKIEWVFFLNACNDSDGTIMHAIRAHIDSWAEFQMHVALCSRRLATRIYVFRM